MKLSVIDHDNANRGLLAGYVRAHWPVSYMEDAGKRGALQNRCAFMTLVALINILASGCFFMMANLAMKQLGTQPFFVLYPTVGLAMMAGAYFQVEALRAARLGSAVAIILSVEIILSFAVAALLLGERFSRADLAGVVLVIAGIAILASGPGESVSARHVEPTSTASGIQVTESDTKL